MFLVVIVPGISFAQTTTPPDPGTGNTSDYICNGGSANGGIWSTLVSCNSVCVGGSCSPVSSTPPGPGTGTGTNPPSSGSDSTTTGSFVRDTSSPAGGLIPACPNGCGFKELMQLVNNVIKFILFALAVPIAALMFVYAGFQMVTSGGNAHKSEQAKKIFFNAVIGIALAAGSWLIIELILTTLGYEGSWIGF